MNIRIKDPRMPCLRKYLKRWYKNGDIIKETLHLMHNCIELAGSMEELLEKYVVRSPIFYLF